MRACKYTLLLTTVYCVAVCAGISQFFSSHSKIPEKYSELDKCLVVLSSHQKSCEDNSLDQFACHVSSQVKEACSTKLSNLVTIFSKEPKVTTVFTSDPLPTWLHDSLEQVNDQECSVLVYKTPIIDRKCLLSPLPNKPNEPTIVRISTEILPLDDVVDKINSECFTHRTTEGSLNVQGYHRQYILNNLYTLSNLNNSHVSRDLFEKDKKPAATLPMCEKVTVNSWSSFFQNILQHSKPVIILNSMSNWTASERWDNNFLRDKYGHQSVHIKMSPTSDYEGIEKAELWDNYKSFKIPHAVQSKLLYPDLVVPRPAPVSMSFGRFIDLMEMIGNKSLTNVSAYLEYSSIRQYFPELEQDISELSFVKGKLKLRHLNIWLSDGNTRGKLHFDPFDNFLCMLDGKKEVILFEPHNNKMLYEGHIPEAQFSVDMKTLKFKRAKLMDSTSMVMSPVDITAPDYNRFPLFKNTRPLNCTISEGEVLFIPSYWWHEVQSYPDILKGRNLAVNYWYEPFLTKEFPCADCRLDVNQFYQHLL